MSIKFVISSLILAFALGSSAEGGEAAFHAAESNPQSVNYAALGRNKFLQKKYDEAIDLFRRHLRRSPKDTSIWNQLGAAYYYTGQPRKALRYLKHVERTTTEKSYNYYYQGLCYLAVDLPDKAREFFTFGAQRYTDEYASRATFEMATIEYNVRNKPRAAYWTQLYLSRYPSGVYAAWAQKMATSLRENRWLDEKVEGTKKPDMEEALFKYNKLSLSSQPHYWYLQGGWQYGDHAGQEPDEGGKIKPRNYQDMAMVVNAGIGIGPYKQGEMTAFAGYTYRQLWNTDQDRIQEWLDSPTNVNYFMLRGDLLERHHQFYADFRRDFGGWLYMGAFGRYEMSRIGSSLFPSSENEELKKVLKIADTQMFIPWIGASYAQNMRTLLYLYFRKQINEDAPEFSNKSYELGAGGGSPVISFGLSHDMDFPEADLAIGFELFQYEFIYNDPWLDYKRQGFFLSAEHELVPRWFVNVLAGYYRDQYVLPRFKLKSCGGEQTTTSGAADVTGADVPKACVRTDIGTMMQLGVYWNWTQFQRFAASYQLVDNKNPDQKEYQESKQTIQVTYTTAFPSVKRVERFVDRYADTAFTKEPE